MIGNKIEIKLSRVKPILLQFLKQKILKDVYYANGTRPANVRKSGNFYMTSGNTKDKVHNIYFFTFAF